MSTYTDTSGKAVHNPGIEGRSRQGYWRTYTDTSGKAPTSFREGQCGAVMPRRKERQRAEYGKNDIGDSLPR
jgi:hypothetical protein